MSEIQYLCMQALDIGISSLHMIKRLFLEYKHMYVLAGCVLWSNAQCCEIFKIAFRHLLEEKKHVLYVNALLA